MPKFNLLFWKSLKIGSVLQCRLCNKHQETSNKRRQRALYQNKQRPEFLSCSLMSSFTFRRCNKRMSQHRTIESRSWKAKGSDASLWSSGEASDGAYDKTLQWAKLRKLRKLSKLRPQRVARAITIETNLSSNFESPFARPLRSHS